MRVALHQLRRYACGTHSVDVVGVRLATGFGPFLGLESRVTSGINLGWRQKCTSTNRHEGPHFPVGGVYKYRALDVTHPFRCLRLSQIAFVDNILFAIAPTTSSAKLPHYLYTMTSKFVEVLDPDFQTTSPQLDVRLEDIIAESERYSRARSTSGSSLESSSSENLSKGSQSPSKRKSKRRSMLYNLTRR